MTSPDSHRIFVHGTGAVSPAGWTADDLVAALKTGSPGAVSPMDGGAGVRLGARRVPTPAVRPPSFQHPRLRRSSAVSHFAVSAALEALGGPATAGTSAGNRFGIVCTVMGGGVSYSRRFFQEVLDQPATASPMLFPETVFNAPAAHLAAVLGATGPNYTLVADQTGFLGGLAVAAGWLTSGQVDACLVVGTEEADWLTARALSVLERGAVPAEGAGAILLRREASRVALGFVTEPVLYRNVRSRTSAVRQVRDSLPAGAPGELLVDSVAGTRRDVAEIEAWRDWSGERWSARRVLGDGFGAAGAWSSVAAVRFLEDPGSLRSRVHVAGANLQAMAAGFEGVRDPR